MKKFLSVLLALVMAITFSVPIFADSANLIVDGGETAADIGDFEYSWNPGTFTVNYTVDAPWEIVETHVYIGMTPPAKSSPGKFPFVAGEIPFDANIGDTVYIAAHAEIRQITGYTPIYDELGNQIGEEPIYEYESVWAQTGSDTLIGKGANWATYFQYSLPSPH